jgi:spore coat polysaccharide biosynthesis protein SpsF (cytidylyltransferase family)
MKTEEDEAFEELAKRQGYWGLQGSRKHQILRYVENAERSAVIDEVAKAVLAEREACAKLCESLPMQQEIDVRDQAAAAIRTRGQA